MAQPYMVQDAPKAQQWSSGMMDCCNDGYIFCVGCNMISCLYGENSRKLDGQGCCCPTMLYYCCGCFACFFASSKRGELRKKYNLPAEPCNDCCVHMWCSPCAVCQEAREMRVRDGWKTWQ